MRLFTYGYILLQTFCFALPVLAQKNPHPAASPEKPKDADVAKMIAEGWSGKMGFGYALSYPSYLSGVFQFAEVSLETAKHRFLVSSETSGVLQNGNIRRSNGVLNAGYDITFDRLRFFVFTNYEFGVIVGLDSNTVFGAGMRYTIFMFDRVHLDASIAPIYDRAAYADDTLYEAFSLSMRGRMKIFVSDIDTLFLSWFYIRAVDNTTNQWHAADIVNSTLLTQKVSMRVGYRWRYDLFTQASAGLAYMIAVFNFT